MVLSVGFSIDGIVASGLKNSHVELWDSETSTRIATLKGHQPGSIQSVAFSPDGTILASAHRDVASLGDVILWDMETRQPIATLDLAINADTISFSPDGALLALGGDGYIKLYDVRTRALIRTIELFDEHGQKIPVNSVSFSPDGAILATGTDGLGAFLEGSDEMGDVRLWDVRTGDLIGTMYVFDVRSVSFSPDGNTLAIATGNRLDGTDVLLWDVDTRELTGGLDLLGDVISVLFFPDGALAYMTQEGAVALRDRHGNIAELSSSAALHAPGSNGMSFSPDGAILASASLGIIKLWDVKTGELVGTLEGDWESVFEVPQLMEAHGRMEIHTPLSFSPDGAMLAAGGHFVYLWDVMTRQHIGTLESYSISSLSFSPDGTTLATGKGGGVILWDLETKEPLATLDHADDVWSVSFSPDGASLASGGRLHGTVRLWDVRSKELIATLDHADQVWSVSFSPDGATLASGAWDGNVRLWDVSTGKLISNLSGYSRSVFSVSFSPDGATLASGAWDGTVRLWDVKTGEPFTTLGKGDRSKKVSSVLFSPNGSTLASLLEGTILLWDLEQIQKNRQKILGKISGDNQRGPAGAGLPEPFVVEVRDQSGDPVEGTEVTFAVIHGEGTLSQKMARTDANGHASSTLTLGSQPGSIVVQVSMPGLEPIIFKALAQPLPGFLFKISGDGQQGPPNTVLAHPFTIQVRDQDGNPLGGVEVTFAVTAGQGTLSATKTTTDDYQGRATSTLTLGGQPGRITVSVTVSGLNPQTFTATAEATPDFDGDGDTGFSDFFLFADAFGGSDPRFDLDGDGSVGFQDFFLLADHFADPARGKLLALARELIGLPDGPQLQQNAPNPFNSETVISWFLLRPGSARVEVFSLTGQRVAVLRQGPQKAGVHRVHWNGRDEEGRPLASGVYLYRLVTDESVQTRKLTLLR